MHNTTMVCFEKEKHQKIPKTNAKLLLINTKTHYLRNCENSLKSNKFNRKIIVLRHLKHRYY